MLMKIIYFSKGIRGTECLQAVLDAGYQVKAIVGVTPEIPLEEISSQENIPLIYPEKPNAMETAHQLEKFQADLFILSGYNQILRPQIFEMPPLGTINLHGGKLPEYRGAAPINWQIINGETTGGCSIIYLDEGIDTGDIILQERYPITPDDTHASVLKKTLRIFPEMLLEVLQQIEDGSVQGVKQDPGEGCYYTRRYPRDSRIHWKELTDVQVRNLVRGMHGPYPAAFTYRENVKVEIDRASLLEETITGIPGRVPIKRGAAVIVLAKNRGLLVEEITIEGAKLTPAEYFQIGDDLK